MAAESGTDIASLVQQVGFPIVIAVWFMWRLEKRMDRLIELLGLLLKAMALLAKSVDHMGKTDGIMESVEEQLNGDKK
jgi:hypothetical protein